MEIKLQTNVEYCATIVQQSTAFCFSAIINYNDNDSYSSPIAPNNGSVAPNNVTVLPSHGTVGKQGAIIRQFLPLHTRCSE